GIGTTLGVFAQTAVLLVAIRKERISLRPLWGLDDRLRRFGGMAAAMVLYVLISQVGLVVGNQIASAAAASGPAIYNYTWLVLMLPFGMIGVTVLTVVMPRLSRNAAANDTRAVLADLSLATRLTMVTLIPIVAFMTVAGPAIGSALFAYGNFGDVDAGYLGMAITLSAFTLIPYALVLLQLRVFYAREQPWTPIAVIVVITSVKIAASLAAPHLTDDRELVAGYLGLANGIGFLAGAVVGYILLRANLNPPGGRLISLEVVRTALVATAASMIAGLFAHIVDQLAGLPSLTEHGGAGSMLRLLLLGLIMLPIIAGVMLAARVPDAQAALAAVQRRFGRSPKVAERPVTRAVRPRPRVPLTYPDQRNSLASQGRHRPASTRRGPPAPVAGAGMRKGPSVADEPVGDAAPLPDNGATTKMPRPAADDFEPDVSIDEPGGSDLVAGADAARGDAGTMPVSTVSPPMSGRPPADYGGDPTREGLPFDIPREPAIEAATSDEDVHLIPGATIGGGRYRLLVFHGGPPNLQFWQALDTALDRQVALTFVDPDAALADEDLRKVLERTQRLSRIESPGIARILDVVNTGSGGLVVSEWIRGGSLQEVAETSPSPIGAARAMQALAAAAEQAHRAGVALSIDHPSRVRVSIEGDVALAFPATMPDATPEDDIRGIGAALYALLTNRWPLPESGVRSGLEPAEVDSAGEPVEPRSINREIPFQISAAAARSVQAGGGIRSAPTLLNLLQQATAIADRTELINPVGGPPQAPAEAARVRSRPPPDDPDVAARRRKGLIVGLSVGAAVIVVALIVLASVLKGIFGDVGGFSQDQLGLNTPSTSAGGDGGGGGSGATVKPVKATVFSPQGEADAPDQASLAIDGNKSTVWPIDTYSDPVPFPNFKNGVGLMLQLPQPTTVGEVTIDLNSTGTSVEIRSAQTPTPSSLADTTVLT
ncbi:MAG: lipid II flippase MurJ, partial [Mycobacterium sp.]